MKACYEIYLDGQVVGLAERIREGLYDCFSCRCKLADGKIYRLYANSSEILENLGIPVPEGGIFTLKARIPAKKLGSGPLRIEAIAKQESVKGKFVPLSPEEPFRYLKRLEDAFLQVRGRTVGIVIPE